MFVAIQVTYADAGRNDYLNLVSPLAFDFFQPGFPSHDPFRQADGTSRKDAPRTEQRRHTRRIRDRPAIRQVQVDSHTQSPYSTALLHSGVERLAIREKTGIGDDADSVSIGNRAVNAFRQSKVIRINNQPFHFDATTGEAPDSFVPRRATEYRAASSNPTATQNKVRIFRIIAKVTPSVVL